MMHFLLGSEIALYQSEDAAKKEEGRKIGSGDGTPSLTDGLTGGAMATRPFSPGRLANRWITLGGFGLFVLVSLPLVFMIGKDFFPYVDSGQMRLHVYPPQGMRPEDSEQYFAAIEKEIRQVVPSSGNQADPR